MEKQPPDDPKESQMAPGSIGANGRLPSQEKEGSSTGLTLVGQTNSQITMTYESDKQNSGEDNGLECPSRNRSSARTP